MNQGKVIESMCITGCTATVGDGGSNIIITHCWVDQTEARGLFGKGITDEQEYFASATAYLEHEGINVTHAKINQIVYEGEQ